MKHRTGFTWIELVVVVLIIAILIALLIPTIHKVRDTAAAMKIMEDTTLPQTPEAARIVDELAKEVKVEVHGAQYHALLNIPVERIGTVTGGMVITALEKGAHAWAASHDMEIIAYAWFNEMRYLRAEFSVRKK